MSLGEALSFHVREAVRGLRHSKIMALVTITSIALSLAVLGAFLLFLKNAGVFLGRLHDQYKLIVPNSDQVNRTLAPRENPIIARDFAPKQTNRPLTHDLVETYRHAEGG